MLATLAEPMLGDDHVFLLMCAYLQTSCVLSTTQKLAKKIPLPLTDMRITCRYEPSGRNNYVVPAERLMKWKGYTADS